MKIGLLTDIHEYSDVLHAILNQLRLAGAEKLYHLGDIASMAVNLDATCKLLLDYDVAGVWGNHDYGLCEMARQGEARKYGEFTQRYMATIQPRLIVDRLHLSHVEPWLDPHRIEDLWYQEGLPESPSQRERLFAASNEWDIAFAGHFHRWFHTTPAGATNWTGETPIQLAEGRHYVIIAACFEGNAALFDTDTRTLSPMRCTEVDTSHHVA